MFGAFCQAYQGIDALASHVALFSQGFFCVGLSVQLVRLQRAAEQASKLGWCADEWVGMQLELMSQHQFHAPLLSTTNRGLL